MSLRHVEEWLALVLENAAKWLPVEKSAEGCLPVKQLTELQTMVEAGEPGIALEIFCEQLEEYDVAVPDDVVNELRDIATAMGMESPWFDRGTPA